MKIKTVSDKFTHSKSVRPKAETLAHVLMCFSVFFDKNGAFYARLKCAAPLEKWSLFGPKSQFPAKIQ